MTTDTPPIRGRRLAELLELLAGEGHNATTRELATMAYGHATAARVDRTRRRLRLLWERGEVAYSKPYGAPAVWALTLWPGDGAAR
jgi:hypothetical protein